MQGDVQGGQHQCNRAEQLDQDVQRWAGGILEGIAHGITDHAGLMRLALFTQDCSALIETVNHLTFGIHAQVTCFDVLLGIVPCAAAVIEEEGKDDTTHRTDHQQARLGLGAEDDADGDRRQHGHDTRQDHGAQCSTCTDVHAARIVRVNAVLDSLGHDLGILTELAAHLLDHALGRGANGADSQGAEEEDQGDANQARDEDQDFGQVDAVARLHYVCRSRAHPGRR